MPPPAGTFGITGTLTLDARGDPKTPSSSSRPHPRSSRRREQRGPPQRCAGIQCLLGGRQSATLGTYSILQGNILSQASITVTTGVTLDGRALARTAAVTLDTGTRSGRCGRLTELDDHDGYAVPRPLFAGMPGLVRRRFPGQS
jgi:hypothetical protein